MSSSSASSKDKDFSNLKAIIKLAIVNEQIEGRNKLPRGRPPKSLSNAIDLINASRYEDEPEDDKEVPGLSPPPSGKIKTPASKLSFKKGPGAEQYSKEKEDQQKASAKKPSFDEPLPYDYKSGKFDIQHYLELGTPSQRLAYARAANVGYEEQGFKALGTGSSRVAYDMPGTGKVLKVALNNKGVAQNREELEITKNIHLKNQEYPIVTKVFGHDNPNEPTWLIAEAVSPIDEEEFEALSGVPWDLAISLMDYGRDPNIISIVNSYIRNIDGEIKRAEDYIKHNPGYAHYYTRRIEELKNKKANISRLDLSGNNKFLKSIPDLANNNLASGDSTRIDHWGKTEDGRVVILDYGFTKDVRKKHYGNNLVQTVNFEEVLRREITQIIKEEMEQQDQDGPFIKGLAKGLAHIAYPFVKARNSVASIDHVELLDIVDFDVNEYFNKMGGEGEQMIPTTVKLGAVDERGKLMFIMNAHIVVKPYDKHGHNQIGGSLEIDLADLEHRYLRKWSTGDILTCVKYIRKIEKQLDKEYIKNPQEIRYR